MPESLLGEGTTYYWRAMFFDNLESGSEWADPYCFTTMRASDVTITDAILSLQIIAGIDQGQNVDNAADVDGDGKIGIEEAINALQVVSGVR